MIRRIVLARSTVILAFAIIMPLSLVGISNSKAQILSNPVTPPSITIPTNISSILGGILNKSNSNNNQSTSLAGGEERTETRQMMNFMDKELSSLNTQANSLKDRISSATFTPGSGLVINLINSAAYMKGQVSVIGGQSILRSVEDMLISKIKAAGPSAFSPAEQAYITTWINDVMSARQNQNDYASKLLPGFQG